MKDGERRQGKERLDARHFKYHQRGDYYICPNGKRLLFKRKVQLNRNAGNKYESRKRDCAGCPYAARCIRSSKGYRTLYIPISKYGENLSQKMREAIDQPGYRKRYGRRIPIIEPVFAEIRYCKGMCRFTVRGREKVKIQWKISCIVHKIGKCGMAVRKKLAGQGEKGKGNR
jgi:hypothetical protein